MAYQINQSARYLFNELDRKKRLLMHYLANISSAEQCYNEKGFRGRKRGNNHIIFPLSLSLASLTHKREKKQFAIFSLSFPVYYSECFHSCCLIIEAECVFCPFHVTVQDFSPRARSEIKLFACSLETKGVRGPLYTFRCLVSYLPL